MAKGSIDRVVVEAQLRDIRQRARTWIAEHPEETAPVKRVLDEAERVSVELCGGDWARLGAALGLLWNKLDTIIRHLSDVAQNTRNR